ncbi:Kanadaptin [Smittium mucronatum]|uniref:Kanadaptin n=1 Tax=Smittium mucronatum TaxID=133383 RepID=A0A1R0GWB0_9FUNG|nr:Kanadaptin [Smittium mucronatum]
MFIEPEIPLKKKKTPSESGVQNAPIEDSTKTERDVVNTINSIPESAMGPPVSEGAEKKTTMTFPKLDYKPPENREYPVRDYFLEVLKQGVLIETINFPRDQDYFVAGRLPNCDIILEHQSASRYHSVIQFCQDGEAYIYDLNSSHKTFLNKTEIPPNKLIKLKVGDQIRFGFSSRIYLFSTDDIEYIESLQNDQESKRKQLLDRSKALLQSKVEQSSSETSKSSEDLVSWGFSEDAVESGSFIETTANPDWEKNSEAFYYSDPKNVLLRFLEDLSNNYKLMDMAKPKTSADMAKTLDHNNYKVNKVETKKVQKKDNGVHSALVDFIVAAKVDVNNNSESEKSVRDEHSANIETDKILEARNEDEGNISKKRKLGPTSLPLDHGKDDIEKSNINRADNLKVLEDVNESWVPPKGQSGDGRTSLNDKFGY